MVFCQSVSHVKQPYAVAAPFFLNVAPNTDLSRMKVSTYDPTLFAGASRVAAFQHDLEHVALVEWKASVDRHQVEIVDRVHQLLELHFPKPLVRFR